MMQMAKRVGGTHGMLALRVALLIPTFICIVNKHILETKGAVIGMLLNSKAAPKWRDRLDCTIYCARCSSIFLFWSQEDFSAAVSLMSRHGENSTHFRPCVAECVKARVSVVTRMRGRDGCPLYFDEKRGAEGVLPR